MDLPYISRSSAVRPTLQTHAANHSSTSVSHDLFGFSLVSLVLLVLISPVFVFVVVGLLKVIIEGIVL